MTAITLKKQLHQAIDETYDTGFLKAVYAMFREYKINIDSDYTLTREEKIQLDEQRKLHKSGKTKSYTVLEVRKMAMAKIRK